MLIALDYDQTYTLDPVLWNNFIDLCLSRNHEVICVTMRYKFEGEEVNNTIGKKCKIYFTGRDAKMFFLNEIGIFPNIWIDDNPLWIYQNG